MSLHIVMGPMFAGKSSEILHITNRYKSLGWPVCLVTHSSDSRYSQDAMLMNHDMRGLPCVKLESLVDLYTLPDYRKSKVVIIDEAQFFRDLRDMAIVITETHKKDLYIVGLDGDADRKPFGQLLECIPLADTVTKLKAFCKLCGDGTDAIFTRCDKPTEKQGQVHVGGADMYQPVCRKHFSSN